MTQLESNDLAIIFNRRVIANYMTSVDLAWQPDIEAEIDAQELVAGLAFWLDRGLEFQAESTGNMFMPVPRILYATGNANFSWDPDAPDPVNRLNKFNDPSVAPVGATATLPADVGGPGIPPCPIPMNEDSSGMRFTFVRTFFDTTDNPPALQVVNVDPNNKGLDVTIQGDVYKGGWFSRRRALDPERRTHKFTMTLRYHLKYVTPQSNTVHLGPVPFRMRVQPGADPKAGGGPPFAPGGAPLPAMGRFIYAFPHVDPATGARMPGLWDLPSSSATPETLVGELFLGEPDDQIFEGSSATKPRYVVVTAPGDKSARHQLIDLQAMSGNILPDPLAEGYIGRLALVFAQVTALELEPQLPSEQTIDLTQPIGMAIGNSLVRFNPTLFQILSCQGAQNAPASPLTRDVLPLFGPTSLTIPMMTYPTVQPIFARIVSVDDKSNGDPGLVNSVRSETQEFNLKSERYFAHPEDAARQSFGIAGALMEDPSDPNSGQGSTFDDFSVALDSSGNPQGPGASFAVGVSALFLREQFANMEGRIRAEILKEQPNAAITTGSQIVDGGFQVYAKAEGEIETPWPFPNIGWEVETWVTARTRVQKRIVVDGSGAALDRFHCKIPQGGLDVWGRDVANGFIDMAGTGMTGAPANPLGYRAYNDPDNGIDCVDNCQPVVRIAPPVINAAGDPIQPPVPPPPCTGTDDLLLFGQISFPEFNPVFGALGVNAGLKPIFEVIIPPPAKDDIEVVQSLDWFAVFASLSLGMLLTVLIPIGGPQLSPIVLSLGLTAIFLAPLASTILDAFIRDEIHAGAVKQGREVLPQDTQPTPFLGMFLVNPTGPTGPAFETRGSNFLPQLQPGAVISRFDVVWTPDNMPQGF